MTSETAHKAGFINIIGLPNAGKSTLTNALMGWELTIVNKKPQTTRHRIHAIINGDNHQVIIADTPGFIKDPEYVMQEVMNKSALSVLEDADMILMVHDITRPAQDSLDLFKEVFIRTDVPRILVLNKSDLVEEKKVLESLTFWHKEKVADHLFPVSAEKSHNVKDLLEFIIAGLPEHPPFFSKDDSSDRNVRFFVSEIIRKHILDLYQREIPYSCQVIIEEYTAGQNGKKTRIRATIFVLRNSQRQIMIGRNGQSIKKLGIRSRHEIEEFIDQEVFLELTVKIRENWRDDENILKRLGY